MNLLSSFKSYVWTSAALVASWTAAGSATACDPPAYVWKTVTVYVTVEKPVVTYETRYHECGTPYQVKVVHYVDVTVPVTKSVKLWL